MLLYIPLHWKYWPLSWGLSEFLFKAWHSCFSLLRISWHSLPNHLLDFCRCLGLLHLFVKRKNFTITWILLVQPFWYIGMPGWIWNFLIPSWNAFGHFISHLKRPWRLSSEERCEDFVTVKIKETWTFIFIYSQHNNSYLFVIYLFLYTITYYQRVLACLVKY